MDAHTFCSAFQSSHDGRSALMLRRLVSVVAALLAVFTIGSTVLAHSGLGAASPSPGSVVGGEITEFQLRYNSTIADVDGSVTDPDGSIIGSDWVQDGNLRVAVTLEKPLSTPGEYAVRHATTDVEDGDRVEAAYLFTFNPAAAPPQLMVIPDEDGFPWIWVVLGVGVLILGALGWQLARSLKRARPTTPTA